MQNSPPPPQNGLMEEPARRREKRDAPEDRKSPVFGGFLRVWDAAILPEEPGRFAPEVR